MKIKLEFTPEQREAIQPILHEIQRMNREGVYCMSAGQVFSDGMVVGIVHGEKAAMLAGDVMNTNRTASDCVSKGAA